MKEFLLLIKWNISVTSKWRNCIAIECQTKNLKNKELKKKYKHGIAMKITIIQNTIDKKPQKHENYNYSEALWLTIKKIIKLDITN